MSRVRRRNTFPYSTFIPDLDSGKVSTLLVEPDDDNDRITTITVQSAFEKCLKESEISTLKATHEFFYHFVASNLSGLAISLKLAFLVFDHSNDDGQPFLDKYSDNIRDILRSVPELIAETLKVVASRQVVRNILEKSGVHSLLVQSTPESLLARGLDEENLARERWSYRDSDPTGRYTLYEDFELELARYQVRQKGLKVRNNNDLVCKLRDEIRDRLSVIEKRFTNNQEEDLSEKGEPEDQDEGGETHTEIEKKRGRSQEPKRIWKHLTISKDETSASDFLHERIIILFVKTKAAHREHLEARHNRSTGVESPEISERGQQTRSHQTRSTEDTTIAKSLPYQSFHWKSLFGTQTGHSSHTALRQQSMGATGIMASMAEAQEDGGNSSASTSESDSFRCRQLVSRITSLEKEIQRLNDNKTAYGNWKIIHFISTSASQEPSGYFDKPVMAPGLKHDDFALRAFLPVTDVASYVKQTGLDFVVSRFYSVSSLDGLVRGALAKKQQPPEPIHYLEHIQLQSQQMIEALQEFLSLQPEFWDKFPDFDARAPIHAPYIFRYMYRSVNILHQLQQPHGDLMRMLISWIDENYAEKYAEADSQLERGVVTLRTMPFLTYPGDVLIWKEKRRMKAAITSSLLLQTSPPLLYWDRSQILWSDYNPQEGAKKGEFSTSWAAGAWNYKFIGEFFRQKVPIELKFKASSLDQEVEISKLSVYPLRFADEKTRLQLENRGRTFWDCRIRNLVSYTSEEGMFTVCGMSTLRVVYDTDVRPQSGERFMVDFQIYKEIHSDSFNFQLLYGDVQADEDNEDYERRKMSSEEMESETPPPQPNLYVFPDTVPGYHLRSKKWGKTMPCERRENALPSDTDNSYSGPRG